MDKTDALNVTFIVAVVVILVAAFIYVNFFEEDDEEDDGEDEAYVDIGVEDIDTADAEIPAYDDAAVAAVAGAGISDVAAVAASSRRPHSNGPMGLSSFSTIIGTIDTVPLPISFINIAPNRKDMSEILERNRGYAEILKRAIRLRGEPAAVKLVRRGEEHPDLPLPEKQLTHCQAMAAAKNGRSYWIPVDHQACKVGASALHMTDLPEKIANGEFHFNIGMHDTPEAAARMIAARTSIPYEVEGEVVAPLGEADFEPDVVILIDIPERVYWVVPLSTAEQGGRAYFSTAPFQCSCEDCTILPMMTQRPNISLGCFGCRKRTDIMADELECGIPYTMIPNFVEHLKKYETGVMTKAKRDRGRVTIISWMVTPKMRYSIQDYTSSHIQAILYIS